MRALVASLLMVLFTLAAPASARAGALSANEREELAKGNLVRRPLDVDLARGSYFGGISYIVIQAPAERVMRVLLDANAYRSILPLTLEAKDQGRRGSLRYMYFRHGGKLGSAGYTAVIRRESPSLLRYWLDPSKPHEIEDSWGYFRVDALGPDKTLFTYAALLLLEPGLVRLFFSEKIRNYALETPLLVKRHVEGLGR